MRAESGAMTMPTDIIHWRAEHTREIAQGLARVAHDLLAQVPGLYGSRPAAGAWEGAAASAATQRHDELTSAHRVCGEVVGRWAQVLGRAADEIATVQGLVAQAYALADRNQLEVHGRGCSPRASMSVVSPLAPVNPAALAVAQRQALIAAQVTAMLGRACQEADDLVARAGAGLAGADGLAVLGVSIGSVELAGAVGAVADTGVGAGPLPTVGTDPMLVAAWWKSLTPLAQAQLITADPALIGRLDGVSVAARDLANRSLLDQAEADLSERRQVLLLGMIAPGAVVSALIGLRPLPNTGLRPILDPGSAINPATRAPNLAELAEIDAKIASIEELRRDLATPDGRTRTLIDLDLSQPRAMAAVGIGDVQNAEHVAVFATGLSSTVNTGLAGYDRELSTALDEATSALRVNGAQGRVAGVVWLDYQAPQWDGIGDPQTSVALPLAAQAGAQRLAPFVNGMVAGRDTPVHLTVVAHSYGSTTLGATLNRHRTLVDTAVVAGSPGLAVRSIDQVKLGSGQLYALGANGDVVAEHALLGTSPATMPGADRLSADQATLPDGTAGSASSGHSAYFEPGTTSVHNIGAVIAGQGASLVR